MTALDFNVGAWRRISSKQQSKLNTIVTIQITSSDSSTSFPAETTTSPPSTNECRIQTNLQYNYAAHMVSMIQNISSFTFSVAANNDACIALGSDSLAADSSMWDICLGVSENTNSVIRSSLLDSPIMEYSASVLGGLEEYRTFWISWFDSYLRVGNGSIVGVNEIMNASLSLNPSLFKYLFVSTGYGSTGIWKYICPDPSNAPCIFIFYIN